MLLKVFTLKNVGQIFRIGTVRYAEGLWRMRRHGPVIVHCTDSEDFPNVVAHSSKEVHFCTENSHFASLSPL